ncbi:MAG: Ig-like domain-containing protein [Thermodesulfobacteriota bacterium]
MTVGEGNVPTPTTPASITLSASSTAVGAGGQSTITAIVRDSSGLAVSDGNPVSFTTSSGTISPTTAVTVGGRVTTTFTGGNTYGQATITATSGTATATLVINVTADVGYLTIATSQTSVKTNNQDSATITATALDENRAAMVGVPVTFSASAGQISAATVLTDENGQAAIEFTSGAYDKTNQTVTITATAPPNLTATIPVQLNGTKILLTINSTALQGLPVPSSATLTVTVQDAGGVGIFGAQVVINQSSTGSASVLLKMAGTAGTGTATLTGTTDVNGKFTVTVTGNNPGPEPVTLAVTSLGAEATQNVTVSGQAFEFLSKSNTVAGPNNVFAFNDLNPDTITRADVGGSFVTDGFAAGNVIYVTGAANPANNGVFDVTTVTATTLTLAATVALTNEPAGAVVTITKLVSADTTIGANTSSTVDLWVRSPGGNNVKISTSAGSLTSLTAVSGNNSTVLTASPDPVTNVVAFTLATPAFPCVAILNAEDATDSSINDSLQVAIAAPSSGALNVTIQALPTVIAPSSGTVSSVSNLSIKVTNAANQVVSGAPVRLTLVNTTGSGEYINPALIYSDAFGQASATFYAGSLPSDSNGVLCVAKLLDANNAAPWVPAETRPQANCFAFTSLGKTITRAFGDFAADGFAVGDRILVTGSQFNDWVYKIGVVAPATLTLVDDVQIKGDQLTDEGLSANFINIEKVDAAQVVVGGSASSVSIGGPTKLEEYNLSTYKSAMSVLVSDSNGNPVAGATVNLSVWPLGYYTGWIDGGWQLCCFNYYPNEDINRNEVLDPGEDVGLFPGQNNGVLDPAKATAGTVPAFVVTDEYGVAEFNFVQQKLYSCWTKVEVRASVVVYGTEAIGILRYGPGYMVVDEDSLDPSPWDSNCLDPFLVPWPCP